MPQPPVPDVAGPSGTLVRLRAIRADKNFQIKKSRLLRDEVEVPGVGMVSFALRAYQQQMVFHLLAMPRFVVGEDTGCGKTVEVVGALAHLWERDPAMRVLIVTTKSTAFQWQEELERFFRKVNVHVAAGEPARRKKAREAFQACREYPVLIYTYRSIVNDFTEVQDWNGYLLVADEATAFKDPKAQVHQAIGYLSSQASRAWGLTATLIRNNLVEGYGIFRVVVPELFPSSPATFMKCYTITQMRLVARNRRVPQVVGYTPDHIEAFKEVIEPHYLGRSKREVASELPTVIPLEVPVPMSPAEWHLYRDAQAGALEVDKPKPGETEKKVTKMSILLRCQQVTDHPGLIGESSAPSSKLEALCDLLTAGDYADQSVIVYSRFKTLIVDYVDPALRRLGVTVTRVTGDEDQAERAAARADFWEGRARVILITSAGGEGINLQRASAIVFLDAPWSAGEYVQVIGRMVRIGSAHERTVAVHLVSKPPATFRTSKTIDDYTLQVLRGKIDLFENVLGRKVLDTPDPTAVEPPDNLPPIPSTESEVDAIFAFLRREAQGS